MRIQVLPQWGCPAKTLPEGTLVLGRGDDWQIDDKRVSRKQAEFVVENSKIYLIPRGINPIYRLNKKKEPIALDKEEKNEIFDGDELALSVNKFSFWIKVEDPKPKAEELKRASDSTDEEPIKPIVDDWLSKKKLKVDSQEKKESKEEKQEIPERIEIMKESPLKPPLMLSDEEDIPVVDLAAHMKKSKEDDAKKPGIKKSIFDERPVFAASSEEDTPKKPQKDPDLPKMQIDEDKPKSQEKKLLIMEDEDHPLPNPEIKEKSPEVPFEGRKRKVKPAPPSPPAFTEETPKKLIIEKEQPLPASEEKRLVDLVKELEEQQLELKRKREKEDSEYAKKLALELEQEEKSEHLEKKKKQAKADEEYAKKLAKELNKKEASSSSEAETTKKKKKPAVAGVRRKSKRTAKKNVNYKKVMQQYNIPSDDDEEGYEEEYYEDEEDEGEEEDEVEYGGKGPYGWGGGYGTSDSDENSDDSDSYFVKKKKKKKCKYGSACYRTAAKHRKEYSHSDSD